MADTPDARTDSPDPTRPLGPNYRKLFSASTISNLGDGIGVIAYPWLATAVTRNAFLIALVTVAQRLPWLVFSLPAGVITDRYDRRTLMFWSSVARTVIALFIAFVVLAADDSLPDVEVLNDAEAMIDTNIGLYLTLLLVTLAFGVAEVIYDNAAQTFMPNLVDADQLERANGRLWSTEQVANTFAGPPLGGFLIAVAFALPFFVDAVTFAVSALLIWLIRVPRRTEAPTPAERRPWKTELAEGFRWLWSHDLLRPMAIILGLLNALGMLTGAILVLFAQEVLDTSATVFAVLMTGGAIGGIIGGWSASSISRRIGPGPSLWLTLLGGAVSTTVTGLTSSWPVVWVMFAFYSLIGVLWNVITVSLRQTIIPDHLLGRVNSVYRFFAWGMMPIGSIVGGLLVAIADGPLSRDAALRLPWIVAGVLHVVLFVFAAPRLTTERIEAARAEAG
ncbi:MAG: MFS transporter [Actinomycetota bacterium]